jgi:hypothetical protein
LNSNTGKKKKNRKSWFLGKSISVRSFGDLGERNAEEEEKDSIRIK